jgi:excisionase family DNA binding protein
MEKLLKIDEVSRLLEISVSQIYKLSEKGLLPSVKIGKSVRFSSGDIFNYIQSCTKKDNPGKKHRMKTEIQPRG